MGHKGRLWRPERCGAGSAGEGWLRRSPRAAVGPPGSRQDATAMADCQHTTRRLAEVEARMSAVLGKLA
jgi:hypothetical protein